ncbi:uncharacterized protein ZBAI_05190 [Zygosaccharomyces bailii ISA1307]|nr:uncharacterized protein ZBAI_05190 [Zygosaccharomyces bailii ISA1307]
MSYLEEESLSDSGLPTREERFDYTNNKAAEYNNPMFGATGSPKNGNPWSFIDVINPKKHALAFARELDNKRGISPENNKDADGSDSGGFGGEVSSQSTIRRLPSGAKPTSTGHTIQATTPVKSNGNGTSKPHEQNLSDVVGQSTPLTLDRAPAPEKVSTVGSDSDRRLKDYEGLLKETEWLHQEIAQLKDQLLRSESQQMAKDGEISKLNKALEAKISTIDSLSASLKQKDGGMGTLNTDLQNIKDQLEKSENSKFTANKMYEAELEKMTKRLEEKIKQIEDMEAKSHEALTSYNSAIEDLRKSHLKEKAALNQKLKKLDANWHDTLEKEKQKLLSEIDGLEVEYDAKTAEFQNTVKEKSVQLSELQVKLQNSNDALTNKVKALEAMQEKLKEKENQLESQIEQFEDLNNILVEKDESLASKVQELHLLGTDIKVKALEAMQEKLKEKENQLESQIEQFEDLNNILVEKDESLASKVQELHLLGTDIKKKDVKLAQTLEELELLKTDLHRMEEELVEKTSDLKTLNHNMLKKENEIATRSLDLQTLQDKLNQKDKELVKKCEDFDLAVKLKNELSIDKEKLECRVQSFDAETKNFENRIANLEQCLDEQRQYHDDFKTLYQSEKEKNDKLMEKMKEVDRFANYIENLRMFEKNIGSLIVNTFQKSHEITELGPSFVNTFKNITGFNTKQHEEVFQTMRSKIDTLELKNRELSVQIEHQWKSNLEKKNQELKQQIQCAEQLQEKLRRTEDKLATSQAKSDIYQEEKSVLLKEKEAVLQSTVTLNDELAKYKSECLDKEKQKFLDLVLKVESLSETLSTLQQEIKSTQKANDELECSLQDKENSLTKLQTLHDSQVAELRELQAALRKLQGDPARKITFEVARRSRPDINATTYDHLMVNKVDSIDMIELQNIVKNIILLLDIPFNKLTKKSPLVAIYLKYERPIFSHFANRLHFQVFNEAIDLRRFSNEAYEQYTENHDMRAIKHPLQTCLDNLHQKVISKI